MLLTHLGFHNDFINWIMGCVSTVSYNILINGSATNFFHAKRGLRQGCPLSPLPFQLFMEGLSILIIVDREHGRFKGIKIATNISLSHLIFVENILIFINRVISDSTVLSSILNIFCKAIDMETYPGKSTLSASECYTYEIVYASQRFSFKQLEFEEELKYIGFRLKPNNYKITEWSWLIAKIESRLKTWHHIWLSRTGRLVLIKFFVEAIPVYWKSLSWIPIGILHNVQQICCKFLWQGRKKANYSNGLDGSK